MVCKPRAPFFILSKTFIFSPQKAMPPPTPATSKPGIVHNLGLVSLYNGCYLYEGQFVNSTCSFNKRMFYRKQPPSTETLLCLALLKGREVPANCGSWRGGKA